VTTPLSWFETFVTAVRTNDTTLGRQLFADDAVGFGTLTSRMTDLDALEKLQWQPTWARVAQWEASDVVVVGAVGASRVVLTFLWERRNRDGSELRGRGTMVLDAAPEAPSGWRCRHSHFSESPTASSTPLASG